MSKLGLFLGIALIAFANGDQPLPFERDLVEAHYYKDVNRNEEEIYRLPQNVLPKEYDVYLDLFFDERVDRPYSYDGRVVIVIQAVEQNVTQIVLHANVDSINTVSVTQDGAPFPLDAFNPIVVEPQYHFLKINLAEPLVMGTDYTLSIEYSNTMNEGPMKRGIWRGWYTDSNGEERIYATTHFQPYNARQAFPCWDEPLFKAVFTLHISRPLEYSETFSNTGISIIDLVEGRRVREHFHPTPKMSSYLVTFLVSETFSVLAQDTSFNPPIRIIGRSNTVGMANYTLEWATKMTQYFDDYLGIPYSSMHPYLLNDHISSPDWASAGTENWGMVSYRELYMIIDPRETLMSVEHYAATLITHELAHKWFGNLITCYWWSNTWINEGYASYFGYIATQAVFPQYDHQDHFNSRYLQASLAYDSSASSEPMNHVVNTPAQVTAHFGTISYNKAASFLRMTANIISEETFRKSCTYFLTDNAFEPTDQYDLREAFLKAINEDNSLASYSSFDFNEYYRIWVNVPGYPVLLVNVDHSSGQISLTQERFFLSASATPTGQIYPIPITYSTKSSPNFENVKPVSIMSTESATLQKTAGEEWVIFNNLQHGLYRVNYDDRTWTLITEALLNEPESIHYLNRAQIVDDVFAFMRSGRMTYSYGFNILRFLRYETNYHVWDSAISGYSWIRNRLRHIPEQQTEFDAFILSYLEHAIEYYGIDTASFDSPTHVMARQIIYHFACTLGHKECVDESRKRFIAYRNNQFNWVSIGTRRSVYIVGVREGEEQDFEFMVNLGNSTNFENDKLEILRALGATKSPELLTRYLELTLTNYVRSHDKANSFNYALLGNQDNAHTILQFVKNNIDAIRVAYVQDAPPNPVQTCLSNLAAYLDEPGLVEFEEWLQSTQTGTAQYSTTLSAIASARTNMAWGTNNVDTILTAARDGATVIATSITMLFLMVVIAISI